MSIHLCPLIKISLIVIKFQLPLKFDVPLFSDLLERIFHHILPFSSIISLYSLSYPVTGTRGIHVPFLALQPRDDPLHQV